MSSGNVILKTKEATKKFGGITAVDNVNYKINEGESAGIIGPNGAGKSTFFNLITGNLPLTKGQIIFENKDITETPPDERVEKGLIRTFQLVSVFDSLTVLDNLILANVRFTNIYNNKINFLLRNRFKDKIVNSCERIIEKVGLDKKKNSMTSNLSYGEKRQLELAIALSLNPKILFLDECLAGLSEKEIDDFTILLNEIGDEITTVIIEHKVSRLTKLVDRISVMHKGQIIAEGKAEEVINRPEVRKVYWGEGE